MEVGLFDPLGLSKWNKFDPTLVNSDAHRKVALEAAEESIVLLKNEKNILPLKTDNTGKIGVIGPAADDQFRLVGNYYGCSNDTWSGLLPECDIKTYLDELKLKVNSDNLFYAQGCAQETNDTSGFAEAIDVATKSDIVFMFMGLRNCEGGQGKGGPRCESEGHDRPDLDLPPTQKQLIQEIYKHNSNIILILTGGGPISIEWEARHLNTILYVWYGGALASEALFNIIFGKSSPSGRLPVMFPKGMEDVENELNDTLAIGKGRTY
eukprot:UN29058